MDREELWVQAVVSAVRAHPKIHRTHLAGRLYAEGWALSHARFMINEALHRRAVHLHPDPVDKGACVYPGANCDLCSK